MSSQRAKSAASTKRESTRQNNPSRKPKNKKKKKTKQRIVVDQQGTMIRHVPFLSQCGRDYIKALMNPFSYIKACVPGLLPNFNQLATAFARGRMVCGTSIGFVIVNPRAMCFNDIGGIACTTAGYAPAAIDLNAGAPGVEITNSNAQFTNAQVGDDSDGIAYRVVGCGLRIRYIGKELDRGGQILAFHDPTHNCLQTRTFSNIDAEEQSRRFTVKPRWVNALYVPRIESEYAMSDTRLGANVTPGTITSNTNSWYLGCIVQPAVTNAVYEWEVVASMEYQGKTVRNQQPTHSDPVVLGSAVAAAGAMPPHEIPSEAAHESVLTKVEHLIMNGVSHVESLNESAEVVHGAYQALSRGWHMLTDQNNTSALGSIARNIDLLQ